MKGEDGAKKIPDLATGHSVYPHQYQFVAQRKLRILPVVSDYLSPPKTNQIYIIEWSPEGRLL